MNFLTVEYAVAEPVKETTSSGAVIPQYQQPENPEPPNMLFGFVRLLFSLGIVILLLYLFLRFLGKRMKKNQYSEFIELIDSLYIGPNRGIHVAEIAGKIVVLGATEQSISFLFEIDDEETIEQVRGYRVGTVSKGDSAGSFASQLKLFLPNGDTRLKNKKNYSNLSDDDFLKHQLQKLQKIRTSHEKGDHDEKN